MSEEESPDQQQEVGPRRTGPSRKYPWAIVVVVALFVIVPFLSWYGTWFGRPLSDAKMEEYLHDRGKPRNVQHALAQVGARIETGDQSVRRWYPSVLESASNESPEVRLTAAWVMGQDNKNEDFHSALTELLIDPDPGVRHNAALALVRFGDARGRSELVAMLQSTKLAADVDGVVELIIKDEGAAVAAGAPLARIRGSAETAVVRAPRAGRIESIAVSDSAAVIAGSELLTLSPESEQVRNALVALYLVGEPDDIPYVRRYTGPISGMPDVVQRQALSTLEAIRARAGK